MAKLVNDQELGALVLQQNVAEAGTLTQTLATENKYVNKNIVIKTTTPTAGVGTLSVTDQGSTDVEVGTAAGGYYPVTADITAQMSVATAGWVDTAGKTATDTDVLVGRIAQSTLANGSTAISSGDNVIPEVTTDQTINITAGYEDARTVIVKGMNAGTQAAATVSGTKAATAPTVANKTASVTNKTQIAASPASTSGDIDKYYIAVEAVAPATTIDLTKTVGTQGYLGQNSQITASAGTTETKSTYYVPLETGAVSSTVDAVTVTPTVAADTTAVTGKTRVAANPTKSGSDIDTYYVAVKATAPATAITISNSVTEGYIKDADVSETAGTTTAGEDVYYVPLTSGAKSAGAGSASASSTNMSLTAVSSAPATGHYFTASGSGTANIDAGWFNANTTQDSNTATQIYTVPDATFSVSGNAITAATAGYVDANAAVATVPTGTLSTGVSSKSGQGYTTLADSSVVIPTDDNGNGGYLYINAGYYEDTQISLGTLIPDHDTTDAVSANILSGYEAFTTDGKRLIGSITTYDGSYTTT